MAVLPSETDSYIHEIVVWVGSGGKPNVLEGRKISCSSQDSNPESSKLQPLYQLIYPGSC